MPTSRSTRRGLLLAAPAIVLASKGWAQEFPARPLRLVVPFPAGGAPDIMARAVAPRMSERLGQPVVIDNKPGAAGGLGAEQVAKAAPDGYTLLVNSSAHTVNPAIYTNLTFDTAKDLPAISLLALMPNVMIVSPAKGWKSTADLVKYAKDNPGKLNYASAGIGSGTHMNAEKFRIAAGFEGQHVPYRGTPEAVADTMNGRTDLYFSPVVGALSLIREGRVQALAVGGPKRSSVLPDVPTTEEAGFKGSAYNFWVGMMAPAGTPPAVIAKLNAAVTAALSTPEVKERLAALGADASPTTPADFDKMIAAEIVENAAIAKQAGIKPQ